MVLRCCYGWAWQQAVGATRAAKAERQRPGRRTGAATAAEEPRTAIVPWPVTASRWQLGTTTTYCTDSVGGRDTLILSCTAPSTYRAVTTQAVDGRDAADFADCGADWSRRRPASGGGRWFYRSMVMTWTRSRLRLELTVSQVWSTQSPIYRRAKARTPSMSVSGRRARTKLQPGLCRRRRSRYPSSWRRPFSSMCGMPAGRPSAKLARQRYHERSGPFVPPILPTGSFCGARLCEPSEKKLYLFLVGNGCEARATAAAS